MTASAFARRLLARWDRRVASPRPLGLVLARPPAPAPGRRRPAILPAPGRHETHVHLRPRIALTVVRPAALTVVETRPAVFAAAAAQPQSVLPPVQQLILRNTSALLAERLVERTLARSTRVEVLARPGATVAPAAARVFDAPGTPPAARFDATATPPAAVPVTRPAELVVRRPAAAAEEEDRAARERLGRAAELLESGAARAAATPAVPPVDLVRLTDQVVAAIDGRLASQAERLGRA